MIVIYHGNCPDGFAAAWVVWNYYGPKFVEYLPYRYGQDPPYVGNKNVIIVDFSFPREILKGMICESKSLTLLDHHKSAQESLTGLNEEYPDKARIVFDMKRSGAQIAWDYYHPNEPRPWFIDYVGDRDLWNHQLPFTKEVNEALHFDEYFSSFEKMSELKNKKMDEFAQKGGLLLAAKNKEINMYAKSAVTTKLNVGNDSYIVGLAGCPRHLRSDVGNVIAQNSQYDFSVVYWYDYKSREWWVSLRSIGDKFNLSEISSKLPNGGGHPRASGFTIYEKNGENLYTYFSPHC